MFSVQLRVCRERGDDVRPTLAKTKIKSMAMADNAPSSTATRMPAAVGFIGLGSTSPYLCTSQPRPETVC